MASAAPLRISRPLRSTPLIRVWALNATNLAPMAWMSRSLRLNFSFASTTMLRPSGVSSASEASCAASASSLGVQRKASLQALERVDDEHPCRVEEQHGDGVRLPSHLFSWAHASHPVGQSFEPAERPVEAA